MPENNSLCASHLPSTEKKEKRYIFEKGRVRVPKRINFWKSSKGGGGGVIFNPKIYVADVGPLYRAFLRRLPKKMQCNFPNISRGVKGRLKLFRKFIRFGILTGP